MRRMSSVLVILVLGCGGSGGGGGDSATSSGLAGVYRVDSRTRRQPCDAAGEVQDKEFTYFAVVDDPLLNGLRVNAIPCTGPERTSCDENRSILFLGERVGDGEWAAGSYQRSASGTGCSHTWLGARVKKTATGVLLQEEYRSEERAAATCDGNLSEADFAKGPSLACVWVEASVGVKP